MNHIRLNIDGEIESDCRPIMSDPLSYLGFKAVLAEGYTLRSFFRMLDRYNILTRINPFLPVFVEQFRSCPKSRCRVDDIDVIKLGKTVEMIGFPGDPGLEIYVTLTGYKGTETVEIKTYWMESLLDMTVKLGRLSHVIFGDRIDTFEYDTVFNLFEFIDGIAWQLSFHNMPAECRISF